MDKEKDELDDLYQTLCHESFMVTNLIQTVLDELVYLIRGMQKLTKANNELIDKLNEIDKLRKSNT